MDFTFEKWLEQEQPAGCVADMQRGWNACAAAIHGCILGIGHLVAKGQ